ncbi:DUF4041 domain-containing protein [Agrobacterium sp. B1(2019)]|uniref:DUF4041 domain-containing protein n=1 Tax=Agrobacterium sp. B1(2019) TaxID=2607032 RepID=UPI0011EE44B9|nr:DUF4041 domain-containing protein [Agrobacterium sp. B1(2019)]TZG37064.1 DUF4041 domain-containing protein [Agrobacterium sp. B1(2019)]
MSPDYSVAIGVTFALVIPVAMLVFLVLWWKQRRKARKATTEAAQLSGELTETNAKLSKATELGRKTHEEKVVLAERMAGLEDRFKGVLDVDAEVSKLQTQVKIETAKIDDLRNSYVEKRATYDRLIKEVAVFDEKLAFAEMGVYEPHFEFNDSEEYKRNIEIVRASQKAMVTAKTAAVCPTAWTVEGSTSKGQTMTNRNIKLTLRAFNNECEAAIANCRWSNVNAMEKRIASAFTQINKLNESNHVSITEPYLKLKFQELFLTHEYREKLKAEREERAELARAAKEEQKLIRDMERAEEEEARYQRLLNKAKAEAESAVGPKLEAFNTQIEMLERDLAEAHAKFERAQAMAEKTRSGYVYIISNVGSFGSDVVKIGLTRRLDPADRIRELGDASVPFVFDTHAIIYSDNAPGLERALHAEFEPVRVNAQNYRKEFFKATLDEVETAVKRLAPDAPFFKDVEAQDYRETLAKRRSTLLAQEMAAEALLPEAI